MRSVHRLLASLLLIAIASLGTPSALAQRAKTPAEQSSLEHMREELGVNGFTAPSIELVLTELRDLQPIPFEKVWRDLPTNLPQDRARIAISAGAVIADGFLVIVAEKQSRLDDVARVLLRLSKGLGVGEHVTRRAKSISELALTSRWNDIQSELVRSQADVEAGMMALRDEEIAHLVSLGGWLRGLEITSGIVEEEFTPAKASRLVQPELLNYFLDRAETLRPKLKQDPFFKRVEADLLKVKSIIARSVERPLEKSDVKEIHNIAKKLNRAVNSGDTEE